MNDFNNKIIVCLIYFLFVYKHTHLFYVHTLVCIGGAQVVAHLLLILNIIEFSLVINPGRLTEARGCW